MERKVFNGKEVITEWVDYPEDYDRYNWILRDMIKTRRDEKLERIFENYEDGLDVNEITNILDEYKQAIDKIRMIR